MMVMTISHRPCLVSRQTTTIGRRCLLVSAVVFRMAMVGQLAVRPPLAEAEAAAVVVLVLVLVRELRSSRVSEAAIQYLGSVHLQDQCKDRDQAWAWVWAWEWVKEEVVRYRVNKRAWIDSVVAVVVAVVAGSDAGLVEVVEVVVITAEEEVEVEVAEAGRIEYITKSGITLDLIAPLRRRKWEQHSFFKNFSVSVVLL